MAPWPDPRFLTLADVAEVLNTSSAQVYALVRRGDLPAIKIGGRGQWRVEAAQLEEFIQRMYAETDTFVDEHPFVEDRRPARRTDATSRPRTVERDLERALLVRRASTVNSTVSPGWWERIATISAMPSVTRWPSSCGDDVALLEAGLARPGCRR